MPLLLVCPCLVFGGLLSIVERRWVSKREGVDCDGGVANAVKNNISGAANRSQGMSSCVEEPWPYTVRVCRQCRCEAVLEPPYRTRRLASSTCSQTLAGCQTQW